MIKETNIFLKIYHNNGHALGMVMKQMLHIPLVWNLGMTFSSKKVKRNNKCKSYKFWVIIFEC